MKKIFLTIFGVVVFAACGKIEVSIERPTPLTKKEKLQSFLFTGDTGTLRAYKAQTKSGEKITVLLRPEEVLDSKLPSKVKISTDRIR